MGKLIKFAIALTISSGLALSPIVIGDALAQSSSKKKSNTGRNVAAGVAAGVVGAIILNEVARGNSGGSGVYVEERGERRLSCRQLERRCDDGQGWACRKLDRDC